MDTYDAFISYSRRDKEFARRLHKALTDYRPPKAVDAQGRHLAVFRDEDDYTGAEYHASIARHLAASRKLIVLCSPPARESQYVEDEVRRFADVRGAEHIIPILVAGVPDNEAREGDGQAAFPRALRDVLELPLAIDYRGFDRKKDTISRGAYAGAWYSVLAGIYGMARSEVEQRERKREARRRRITTGIVGGVMSTLLAALVVTLFYWRDAVEQRTIAVAKQLAAQAELARNRQPNLVELSLLLATESMKRSPTREADLVLRSELSLLPRPLGFIQDPKANLAFNPATVAFSRDRRHAATATVKDLRVWDLAAGRQLAQMTPLHPLLTIRFSPDGAYVATGTGADLEGTIRAAQIWQVATGREVARMIQETAPVERLAFSPDGAHLATVDGTTVRLWQTLTGQQVAVLGHTGKVHCLEFSSDGRYVATGTADGQAIVWSLPGGAKVSAINQNEPVSNLAFSPDGRSLAASGADTRLLVVESGREVFRVPGGGALWFSRDGKQLVSAGEKRLVLVDTEDGEPLTSLTHDGTVTDVVFQSEALYVATTHADGIAKVWRGRIGALLERATFAQASADFSAQEITRVVQQYVSDVVFTADGDRFATADGNGRIRLWGSTFGQEVASLTHDSAISAMSFSGDGKYLMTAGDDVRLWEIASRREVSRVPFKYGVHSAALSPGDGTYIAVAGVDEDVRIVDGLTGRDAISLSAVGTAAEVAFSPDGRYLATAGNDNKVRVWGLPLGEEIASLSLTDGVRGVVFSHDGKRLATPTLSTKVVVTWDVLTARELGRLSYNGSLMALALDREGRRLAAATVDGPAGLLWVSEGDRRREIAAMTDKQELTAAAFSPDGDYVAAGTSDSMMRVWTVTNGKEVAHLAQSAPVVGLTFSRDGRYLVSASADGAARVWVEGREVARLQRGGPVLSNALSADGRYFATAGVDGVVRISLVATADLIAAACDRLTRNLTADEWRFYLGDEPYARTCPNRPGQ